jgi:hypothetical protein
VTYTVEWGYDDTQPDGHGLAELSTAEEVGTLLDSIGAQCAKADTLVVVYVYPSDEDDGLPTGMQIGVGHPERSFAYWMGDEGGVASEPDLSPGPAGLGFDYGGQPFFPTPDELRIRPETARLLAQDYVRTGRRPTRTDWI